MRLRDPCRLFIGILILNIIVCAFASVEFTERKETPTLTWLKERSTENILYYYVAANGSDSNPGSESEPFLTIYKAKEVVRSKKESWDGPITVYFREGVYPLPKPVEFLREDSGVNATNVITYQNYPGETPVFSGGLHLQPDFEEAWSGWSNQNGANNIYGQISEPGKSTETIIYLGKFNTLKDCAQETIRNGSFTSYTYTDISFKDAEWRLTCYARLDGQWKITQEDFIVSGRPFTVYQAYVPELINATTKSLFMNNTRLWPARFPDADYDNQMVGGSGYRNVLLGLGGTNDPLYGTRTYPAQPSTGLVYNPATWSLNTSNWEHVTQSTLHVFPLYYWGNLMYRIKEVTPLDNTIKFGAGGGQINLYKFIYGSDMDESSRFFVENIFQELDGPGEFFFNKTTGMLYIVPNEGIDLNNTPLVFPQVEQLFRFLGDLDPEDTYDESSYVQYLAFDGLVFAHTLPTYMRPYQVPSDGDWTIHRGGALFFETARKISLTNSVFFKVNGNAVFLDGSCEQIIISNNEFNSPGDSAVALVGYRHRSIGSSLQYPKNCEVSYNNIHNLGFYGKQTAGVFVSIAKEITIVNNLIQTMPRAAILVNDGFNGGHIVEYNTAFRCVMETSDHACYNSWGRERFWSETFNHPFLANASVPFRFAAGLVKWDVINPITVRNNLFSYYVITADGVIDMDDGTSNHIIYENVCLGGAIKIGSTGDYHNVFNNIFYDVSYPLFFWSQMNNNYDLFYRNILVYTNDSVNPNDVDEQQIMAQDYFGISDVKKQMMVKMQPKYELKNRLSPLHGIDGFKDRVNHIQLLEDLVSFKDSKVVISYVVQGEELPRECDHNLLYQEAGDDNFGIAYNQYTLTWAEWNDLGYDQNSIIGKNPEFFDPQHGNFTLQPGSPAFKLGFENFDYGTQSPVGPKYSHEYTTEPEYLF